jgi:PLP dependent protein
MIADVPGNLAAIAQRIAVVARESHRDPSTIDLVAVSKTHPAESVIAALEAGHRIFGENRVQETATKYPPLRARFDNISLHLIGPLQTNKALQAVELFDVIETIDRPRLAVALADAMAKTQRRPECYIQVNTGEEPQKAGVLPGELDALIAECRRLALPLTGLMCIPPADESPAPHFALLRAAAARCGLQKLSMGMSGDFETAIRFGATSVRVGTAIFGTRAGIG